MKRIAFFLLSSIFGLVLVYGTGIYGGFFPIPYKVTDPAHPDFNVEAFRFEDYPSRQELNAALEKLFPPGTPIEQVDRVLVESGGARKAGPFALDDAYKDKYKESKDVKEYRYFKITLRSYLTGPIFVSENYQPKRNILAVSRFEKSNKLISIWCQHT